MNEPGAQRILLVEDNDLNRALVRAVLTRSDHPALQGCTLVEAVDLKAARAELDAASYDAILLDMQLPDGNGLTLARELLARPAGYRRPVIIALTASVMPEQQHLVLAAGCDAFLGKPYRPQQLVEVLTANLPAVGTA